MCMFNGVFGGDSGGNWAQIRIVFSAGGPAPHTRRVPLLPDISAYLLMRSDG